LHRTLGGGFSRATAINAVGQVVGDASVVLHSAAHAFLYDSGGMHDLGTLSGSSSSAAAINAAGQVVGTFYAPATIDPTILLTPHAFLYHHGSILDLGSLSTCDLLSDSGQLVEITYYVVPAVIFVDIGGGLA
jgi:probable HAF family extracellular repeat protein